MSYEKYYTGGWRSGQTGGTPITPEALNHIENGIMNCAPSGYGLGSDKSPAVPDIDAPLLNGWIRYDGEIEGVSQWVGMQYMFDGPGNGIQELWSRYSGFGIRRIRRSSVWQPWEWIQPPMNYGVEYRTIEQYNGLPVYVMTINGGTAVNGKQVTLPEGQMIKYTASLGSSALPCGVPKTSTWWATLSVNSGFAALDCSENWVTDGYNLYIQVWYTK